MDGSIERVSRDRCGPSRSHRNQITATDSSRVSRQLAGNFRFGLSAIRKETCGLNINGSFFFMSRPTSAGRIFNSEGSSALVSRLALRPLSRSIGIDWRNQSEDLISKLSRQSELLYGGRNYKTRKRSRRDSGEFTESQSGGPNRRPRLSGNLAAARSAQLRGPDRCTARKKLTRSRYLKAYPRFYYGFYSEVR